MDRPPLSLPRRSQPRSRRTCIAALEVAGNIVGAAQWLGITRHALKRRMIKLDLDRPKTTARTPRDLHGQGG